MLWTLGEICGALGVAVPSESDAGLAVTGVSIDSRTVVAGDVFVALKGTPGGGFVSSFGSAGDGHDYVKMAIEKGTVAVIVDHEMAGVTVPQIVVPCTHMEGLWKLGEAARTRFEGLVIGLTGSAGKSGTKELLAALLDAPASVGSYNNFWGVPLTLARLDPLAKFAVLEMGMNQVGEMARLSALVRPHVAVVVNVLPVHLEHIGSLEGIRQEKLSIAAGLVEEGLLVLPEGLSAQESGVDEEHIFRFSKDEGSDAHVCAGGWHAHGDDWHVTVDMDGDEVGFMLKEGAPHRLYNLVCACAAAYAAGFEDWDAGAARVAQVGVMNGRGLGETVGGVTVIDDSFNGNPASMRAALDALVARPVEGRRVALLGDMLELGEDSPAYHAGLLDALDGVDAVWLVGPLMRHLAALVPAEKLLGYTPDEADFDVATFATLLHAGDAVVVKASKKIFYVRDVVGGLKAALA